MGRRRINVKEITSLINMAMQGHPTFQGNASQLQNFFNEEAGVKIKHLWPTLRTSFEVVATDGCSTIYKFYMDANGHPKPLHYTLIEKAYANYADYMRGKKKEAVGEEQLVENAINLLKSRGYRVFQPVTDYKEI